MAYEDTIRVADLKTRRGRFERLRGEVAAAPGQIVGVSEFMHPRFQDLCETLPAAIGHRLARSAAAERVLTPLFRRGRRINTTRLTGFIALYTLAALRRWRRGTLRYRTEQGRIDAWLAANSAATTMNYALAVQIAECQRLVKGYGDTHERGMRNFAAIMEFVDRDSAHPDLAAQVRKLRAAALADDNGREFGAALHELSDHTARLAC